MCPVDSRQRSRKGGLLRHELASISRAGLSWAAMVTLFGDESCDDHTYALGGWVATPTHWSIAQRHWRDMLATITMPDGTPCKAFHTSLINSQSEEFTGWGKTEAFVALDKATAVLTDKPGRYAVSPFAVATDFDGRIKGCDRDAIWLMLFMRLFLLILNTWPAFRSIEFVFDEKREIKRHATMAYNKVRTALLPTYPDTFLEGLRFVSDDKAPMIQAADLLVYEWRKNITDRKLGRTSRPWFPQIRAVRTKGALVRYDDVADMLVGFNRLEQGERVQKLLAGTEAGRD